MKEKFIWTNDLIEKASAMWRDDCSAKQIADELGTNRNSVLGVMHRNRDMFPKFGSTTRNITPKKVIDRAAELWQTKMSAELICLEMGLRTGQLAGIIKRNRERFPKRKTGRKKKGSDYISVDSLKNGFRAQRSSRNDPVHRLSKFNPNAGSKSLGYKDPELDEFELSRLPGVSLMDNTGCMYPLTDEGPHLFCGHSRFKGRYCGYHTYKCEGYKGINVSYKNSYYKNIIRGEAV